MIIKNVKFDIYKLKQINQLLCGIDNISINESIIKFQFLNIDSHILINIPIENYCGLESVDINNNKIIPDFYYCDIHNHGTSEIISEHGIIIPKFYLNCENMIILKFCKKSPFLEKNINIYLLDKYLTFVLTIDCFQYNKSNLYICSQNISSEEIIEHNKSVFVNPKSNNSTNSISPKTNESFLDPSKLKTSSKETSTEEWLRKFRNTKISKNKDHHNSKDYFKSQDHHNSKDHPNSKDHYNSKDHHNSKNKLGELKTKRSKQKNKNKNKNKNMDQIKNTGKLQNDKNNNNINNLQQLMDDINIKYKDIEKKFNNGDIKTIDPFVRYAIEIKKSISCVMQK